MATPSNADNRSRFHRYVPQAKSPPPGLWQTLDASSRKILERFLEEPVDCVFQARFELPQVEDELFGRVSDESADARVAYAEHCKIGARPLARSDANETLLFERYNYARYRICRILQGFEGKVLAPNAAREVLRWGRRALQTRADIIQMNMPLVLSMAKRSRLEGLDFNEMISEGNMALIRSVEKFDSTRGFKFSTYSCRAILKSFSRVALKTSRYRGLFPMELTTELERSDFLDRKREDLEETYIEELKHVLGANLAELNEVEQTVITERFALGAVSHSGRSKTLEQVGAMIGVTKERVRQIQNKALCKIRVALEDQEAAA